MDFVGNSPRTTHCAGSALIQITGSPFGGIKALCVLLSRGTGGKSFPPLIISNQRFGEMLRGLISFIGGFLASRVFPVAADGPGKVQPKGSRGNLRLPWLCQDKKQPSCGMWLLCQKPGSLRGWQEQQGDYSPTIGLPTALPH